MSLANGFIDVLRDWKRIAEKPSDAGAGRLALWSTHARLKLALLAGSGATEADVLGFRVRHLGLGSLVHLFREIFVGRVYDVGLESRAPRIIDCGSNIGMSILFFKNLYPDARILGFEPHPAVYDTLARNVETNALHDVSLQRKALGGEPGALDFYVKQGDNGALDMGLFAGSGEATMIKVECETLSPYIDGPVDLLKLDIEGAEEMVLDELARADRLRHVRNIVCEYHHHIDPSTDRLSRTLAILESAGFGYQVSAYLGRPAGRNLYQDVIIYAYRKRVHGPVVA